MAVVEVGGPDGAEYVLVVAGERDLQGGPGGSVRVHCEAAGLSPRTCRHVSTARQARAQQQQRYTLGHLDLCRITCLLTAQRADDE